MQSLNRLKSTRPRRAYDFYETPIELCRASLEIFREDEKSKDIFVSVDAGAGYGVWGQAYIETLQSNNDALYGVEQNIEEPQYDVYDYWINKDYLNWELSTFNRADFIFGNPPYSLAEEFVRHSMTLLEDGGYVFFLLRLAFLESKKRHFGLFTDYPPKRVYVLSRRPSFFTTKGGRTKTTDALAYAMFLWQNGWNGKTELEWMYWQYDK